MSSVACVGYLFQTAVTEVSIIVCVQFNVLKQI